MGSVYKKQYTTPIPAGAEIIVRKGARLAKWRGGDGKMRTAPVVEGRDGTDRVRLESATYTAKHRDGSGFIVETATGCRDKGAAMAVLASLERQAEKIRSGVMTTAEARIADHLATPIGPHVADYLASLEASGASPKHVVESRRVLIAALDGCGFRSIGDFDRSAVETWLNARRAGGASGRTRNIDLTRLVAFANWLKAVGRIARNPFEAIPKADESAAKKRRSLTENELSRLLAVARRRPLEDALTIRMGPRKGQLAAKVRDDARAELEAAGRERALLYKTLVTTGLRRGELASITIAQLRLDGRTPFIELDAPDEKNRQGTAVAIRADLADDLRAWLADRLGAKRAEALQRGEPAPDRLDGRTPLFYVPSNLLRTFDRDLKAAGIDKIDDRGRTLDVHALRTTFGTMLSKGGVPLRTAQAAMRHSDPKLTANVYTDPRLLDTAGALDALPSLPLDAPSPLRASNPLAPVLAPNFGIDQQNGASTGKTGKMDRQPAAADPIDANPCGATKKPRQKGEALRAGEGIRTPDVQLGKQHIRRSKPFFSNDLRRPLPALAPVLAPENEIEATGDLEALADDLTPNERKRLIDLITRARGRERRA